VALIRAKAAVAKVKGDNVDQDAGVKLVLRAIEAPLRTIVANAGDEPSVVVNNVANGKDNYGYNAATGEYGDLVTQGVLDPTKVTRTALQNAASVAALLLTTEAAWAVSNTRPNPESSKQYQKIPAGRSSGGDFYWLVLSAGPARLKTGR